jgi:Uma2 family endonuclease
LRHIEQGPAVFGAAFDGGHGSDERKRGENMARKTGTEGIAIEVAKLFPVQGKWTERDYFSLPETNRIVELSEGRLIITPSPTTQHQGIVLRISHLLIDYLSSHNLGEIIIAPMDVRLWEGTIRQPDIVFMSNGHRDRISEKYWGVPDLVMEILSESTEIEDRTDKFYEYEKAGVTEYWLAGPAKQTIEVFALERGTYVLLGKWGIGEVARSRLLTGFEIAVDAILGT